MVFAKGKRHRTHHCHGDHVATATLTTVTTLNYKAEWHCLMTETQLSHEGQPHDFMAFKFPIIYLHRLPDVTTSD